jgi:TolA-binding protein
MRQFILRAALLCAVTAALAAGARAQSTSEANAAAPPKPDAASRPEPRLSGNLYGLDEMRRQLREQREEIDELRAALREQSRLMGDLRSRVEQTEQLAASQRQGQPAAPSVVRDAAYKAGAASAESGLPAGAAQDSKLEERVANVEKQASQAAKTGEAVAKQIGSMTFGGDMRLRYESFYGQQNALASAETPGAFGNPLSTRQRLRMRARFSVRGRVSNEFEWGLRLATGSYADVISTNQTLTDFFTRKPFGLDYAYIVYRPKGRDFFVEAGKLDPGRRFLPAGKTEDSDQLEAFWTRTEMTWDADLNPEGLMETYAHAFKGGGTFKNVVLQAWQFPMLERNSAFVLGADGSVDASASGRAGRDLALYGAQARTEMPLPNGFSLKLSAADLYFSGTQFITPAQVFGGNIQFPVTFTIPASGSTPARTVTTQVSVPRDLLVSGNANLGLSLANTNAVNRDGRLSSGFNLVDLIARLDYRKGRKSHWPVMLLFDFVTNTQTHDVVTAGPGGADLLLPNHEGQGYWAEMRVGRDVVGGRPADLSRGDLMFDYVLTRVEKDAILSPFNGSDLGQSTDMRVHRFVFGYALDPKVAVAFTGFFTQRPTGLLGAFAQTPPGSLNRTLTRLQFDTILRF